MTTPTENHVIDDIPAYISGGLSPSDRESFDQHIQRCPACARALAESLDADQSWRDLFSNDQPNPNFEDRMIAAFRRKTLPPRIIHPMVRKAATGAAAVLFLGAFGYFATQTIEKGRLPEFGRRHAQATDEFAFGSVNRDGSRAAFYGEGIDGIAPAKGETVTKPGPQVDWAMIAPPEQQAGELSAKLGKKLLEQEIDKKSDFGDVVNAPAGSTSGNPGPNVSFGRRYDQGLAGGGFGYGGIQNGAVARTSGATAGVAPTPVAAPALPPRSLATGLGVNTTGFGAGGGGGPAGPVTLSAPGTGAAPRQEALDLYAADAPVKTPPYAYFRPSDLGRARVEAKAGRMIKGEDRAQSIDGLAQEAFKDGRGGLAANNAISPRDDNSTAVAPTNESAPQTATPKTAEAPPPADKPVAEVTAGAQPAQGQAQTPAVSEPTPPPAPATPPPAAPAPAPVAPPPPVENAQANRKIIRQGEMTFEVDSFDSSIVNVTKIVQEEQGFVATTDSDKLANGKVKGSIVLRVPPEHLDTLVLKLRGIGDLKSQKITAQDITKQYTDLESELRAARAMEERLLAIIKDGKGAVKDLLEAEKQLGVWREKIEQVEGEIRYDNNLVSLSTLTIDLIERDLKSAAFASETEQVNMSLETEKVDEAYNAAKDAIANAKGRITQSELKQYEAGQFGASIGAQLPPDAADAVIARLRQISGRVANFQRTRSQSNQGGSAAPLDASKIKREDVSLSLTLYNLANIAPRRTTSFVIAAANVEESYNSILDQATAAGARIVTSTINRPRPDQSAGSITLQAPTDKADALFTALRGAGELVRQETTENPDTQNVTNAKRGLVIEVISLASLAPRRNTSVVLAAVDVDAAYRNLLDKIGTSGGRIISSTVNRGSVEQTNATITFQAPSDKADSLFSAVREAGEVMRQDTAENPDAQNTSVSKRGFSVQVVALAGVPARQTQQLQVAAVSVPDAFNGILEQIRGKNARIVTSQLNQQDASNVSGTIEYELPRAAELDLENSLNSDKSPGGAELVSRNISRSQDTESTVDSKIRGTITFTNANQMAPRQTTSVGVEVTDVQKAVDDLVAAAVASGGRTVDRDISQEQNGRTIARVTVDVPLDKADTIADQVERSGNRRVKQMTRNPQAPEGKLARGRIEVTFANAATSLGGEETTADALRHGLSVSAAGLRWSVQMIVVGLCFVAPWALLLWGAWRLSRRSRRTPLTPTPTVTA